MSQIFSARADRLFRRLFVALLVIVVGAGGLAFTYFRSSAYWGVGGTAEQPIGFRHDLHAGLAGLGCGFCHQGATKAAAAGMPSAETCLVCHNQLWRGTQALQPVFTSAELGQPIRWTSLYRLPEHVRFHHGAHAANGIGCATCHGDLVNAVETKKEHPMSMAWCLDCHERVGRERQQARLARIDPPQRWAFANPRLTDCSVCHY